MGLFKVVYQVFIAGVVNKTPIAPAPRQRTKDETRSLISLIFTIPVYQNLMLRIQNTLRGKIALGRE